MRKVLLYTMSLLYIAAGINHFLRPAFYDAIIPDWLPAHSVLTALSGVSEILLGVLLVPARTRKISSVLIVLMLVVFLILIHIPMTIDFYHRNDPKLWLVIVRLPIQFVLIYWAWAVRRPSPPRRGEGGEDGHESRSVSVN